MKKGNGTGKKEKTRRQEIDQYFFPHYYPESVIRYSLLHCQHLRWGYNSFHLHRRDWTTDYPYWSFKGPLPYITSLPPCFIVFKMGDFS